MSRVLYLDKLTQNPNRTISEGHNDLPKDFKLPDIRHIGIHTNLNIDKGDNRIKEYLDVDGQGVHVPAVGMDGHISAGVKMKALQTALMFEKQISAIKSQGNIRKSVEHEKVNIDRLMNKIEDRYCAEAFQRDMKYQQAYAMIEAIKTGSYTTDAWETENFTVPSVFAEDMRNKSVLKKSISSQRRSTKPQEKTYNRLSLFKSLLEQEDELLSVSMR